MPSQYYNIMILLLDCIGELLVFEIHFYFVVALMKN